MNYLENEWRSLREVLIAGVNEALEIKRAYAGKKRTTACWNDIVKETVK